MTTFDGWETQLYGDVLALPMQSSDEELAHFRTKGSKNGVRRYQTESGEWTPLGLKERKAREGWGDSKAERKAARQVAKSERKAARAEKRVARSEKRSARKAARNERMAAYKEKKRLGDVSKLTDEELRKKIARVKMEQEYKELTRSPVLKSGEKLVSSLLAAQEKKYEREAARARNQLENNRIKADIIKAQENTKRAQADASKAAEDRKKMEADVEGGLKIARKAELKKAKTEYRGTTLRGGIARALNTRMTAGLKEMLTAKRKAKGEAKANEILSNKKYDLKQKENARDRRDQEKAWDARNKGVAAYEKEQAKLRKERLKVQDEYTARVKKMQSDAAKTRKQQESRAAKREKDRKAEQERREAAQKKRQEQAEAERKKREKKLQKAYNKEINRYDKMARAGSSRLRGY